MKTSEGIGEGGDRLLMFLFDDVRYALPIAWVVEVAEKDRVTSVPSLALPIGGVMNRHGEALPLVATELLLGRDRDEAGRRRSGLRRRSDTPRTRCSSSPRSREARLASACRWIASSGSWRGRATTLARATGSSSRDGPSTVASSTSWIRRRWWRAGPK
ncbi:MAG: chemotaxis protein CheW [Deltaproteobacteria bacterium]|nr:chemotaxis protein CheW [Deltaproteobacteria bacterium]